MKHLWHWNKERRAEKAKNPQAVAAQLNAGVVSCPCTEAGAAPVSRWGVVGRSADGRLIEGLATMCKGHLRDAKVQPDGVSGHVVVACAKCGWEGLRET